MASDAPAVAAADPWRLCVAPMMDWTDRHCRYFHRQLAPHARLYTEMITAAALRHGDLPRHLDFDAAEHPLALQLGGSEPDELAAAARLGASWGYDEINLNCGCPSPRVQRGAFGACLMAEPARVAECVRAMRDAVDLPVTVKHRLGLDQQEDYGFVRDFVGALFDAGCRTFIVHARNAWLEGLSPRDNRSVPPLRYDAVYRLKRDFPLAAIVLNGGLTSVAACRAALAGVDGVMLGRAAYHEPALLAALDTALFGAAAAPCSEDEAAARMGKYTRTMAAAGTPVRAITRHLLGLFHGRPGARAWRRALSDPAFLATHGLDAIDAAHALLSRR